MTFFSKAALIYCAQPLANRTGLHGKAEMLKTSIFKKFYEELASVIIDKHDL